MQEVKSNTMTNRNLESAIQQLRHPSPEMRELVLSLIGRLAQAEGVPLYNEHRPPAENMRAWLTKLRAERKSERTIKLYGYLAERFLKHIPAPTRADVREYLAARIGETSPSSAETERKALASLFSFLSEDGLWHENPLEGVKHIGPRWGEGERRCPSVGDVERVLEAGCARANDSLKIRMVVVLLATTGLRLTECMSLRKDGVDLEARELRVVGKGGKRRIVPLLESTARMLSNYLEERQSGSPYVFPGNTRTGYAEIYNVEKTLRLMLIESNVMTSVLLSLMELGIPALPVHDSLIVPRRHKDRVKQVMEDAYRERTSFTIPVG